MSGTQVPIEREPEGADRLTMRQNIAASKFCMLNNCPIFSASFMLCHTVTLQDGLQIGDVVEVWNKDGPDKWYMRITNGTVAGEADDPYLVGGQWLKANQTVLIEKPIKNNVVRIRTILNVVKSV